MKPVTHGDLRSRHVRIHLDLRFARYCGRPLGVQKVLRFHQRSRATDAGAVHHTGAQRIEISHARLPHGLLRRGQGELRE
jgi:hypothetical protein